MNRQEAAAAALAEFRAFDDESARIGYLGHGWATWARRLADELGAVLPPAPAGQETPAPPLALFPVDSQGRVGGDLFEDGAGL